MGIGVQVIGVFCGGIDLCNHQQFRDQIHCTLTQAQLAEIATNTLQLDNWITGSSIPLRSIAQLYLDETWFQSL